MRTVYRYFPTREDLLVAVDEAWTKKQPRALPENPLDLAGIIPEIFRYFEANKQLLEAAAVTSLGRQVNSRARSRRIAAMKDMFAKHAPHLDERQRLQRVACVRLLSGSDAWRTMTRDLGMTTEEAIGATTWALTLLLEDTLASAKKKGGHK